MSAPRLARRSQTSLVLTLASLLIILTLTTLAYYAFHTPPTRDFDETPFRMCVRAQAEEAVLASALSGGVPSGSVLRIGSAYEIRVWLDDGTLSIPSREQVEVFLAGDIASRIVESCGMVVYQHEPSVTVSVRDEDVLVTVQPFAVNGSHRIKPVRVRIAYPYGQVYDAARRVVREMRAFRVLENLSVLMLTRTTPFSLRLSCDQEEAGLVREAVRVVRAARLTADHAAPGRAAFSLPSARASGLAITLSPLPRLAHFNRTGGSRFVTLALKEECAGVQAGWSDIDLPILLQFDNPSLPVPFRVGVRMRFTNTLRAPGSVHANDFCQDVTIDPLVFPIRDEDGNLVPQGSVTFSCPLGGSCSIPFSNGLFTAPIPWRCHNFSLLVEAPGYYPLRTRMPFPPREDFLVQGVRLERAPVYTLEIRGTCPDVLIGVYDEEHYTFEPIRSSTFTLPRPGAWRIALARNGEILQSQTLPLRDARIRISLSNACMSLPSIEVIP